MAAALLFKSGGKLFYWGVFWRDNAIFGRRTVPGMCEPDLSIDNDNGFRSIFGPGPALKRSRDTSGNGGGLPEGGKRARSSGLERISWILSAGCSGLACQGATEWAGLGWAGLGWAGWAGLAGLAGWLAGWLAGVTGVAKGRARRFRTLRPRPAGLWGRSQ